MNNSKRDFFYSAKAIGLALTCLFSFGCGRSPEGTYEGEVKDWVKWVFEGNLVDDGSDHSVELVLRQDKNEAGQGSADLSLADKSLNGKWSMEEAKRRIVFDEKVYFLSKQGVFYVLQAKDFKLENDDGSPVRLLLNKGRSRERGVAGRFEFQADGKVLFDNDAGVRQSGEWENLNDEVVARFEDLTEGEVTKFYFSWDEDDLLLSKWVIMLGVGEKVKNDFGAPARKSRSPRRVFADPPRFRRR